MLFCIFALKLLTQKMKSKNLNRIRVILAEKNLNNKWLAEKLGRDQATISKWVTNSAQPNLEMLVKIADSLEVNIDNLVRKEEILSNKTNEL